MTAITIVFHGIRFVMYYFHERIWEQIEWGKITHPLSGLPVTKSLEIEDAEIIKDKLKELGYID